MTAPTPCVAVWRHRWLQMSETFIKDQIGALRSWRALKVGRYQVEPTLLEADVAPFTDSLASRARLRLLGPRAAHSVYRKAFSDADVRLVHAHFATEGNTVVPLARSLKLPLVVTCHGYDVTASLSGSAQARRLEALALCFSYASRLIAVSDFIADRLLALGAPPEKVVVHRIGIRTDGVPADAETGPRAGVLFAGRFVEKKGIADLLRAYAALPTEIRSNAPLALAGDGDDRASVERLAHGLGVEPVFLGWQDPVALRHLMRRASVFCAPSRTASDGDSEGYGMVFLEAALCGAPSVSYRHGGVPEAVLDGQTGLLADEGDVDGLSKALEAILTDPERGAQLGRAGRDRVLRDLDIAHTTPDLEAIYDEVSGARLRR